MKDVIRIFMALLVVMMTGVGLHAENVGKAELNQYNRLVCDGVVYTYTPNSDSQTTLLYGISSSARPEIVIPDYIEYDGIRYQVVRFFNVPRIGETWYEERVKKIRLSKFLKPLSFENCYDVVLEYNYSSLEEITVDPENQYCEGHDGILYRKKLDSESENGLYVHQFPMKKKIAGPYRLHPNTVGMDCLSIFRVEELETLVFPENFKWPEAGSVWENPNLKHIVFEGNSFEIKYDKGKDEYLNERYYQQTIFWNNPSLRSVEYRKPVKDIFSMSSSLSPNLVKVSLRPGTESICAGAFSPSSSKPYRVMFFDLPDIKTIDRHGLGAPQAVRIGDKVNWYSEPEPEPEPEPNPFFPPEPPVKFSRHTAASESTSRSSNSVHESNKTLECGLDAEWLFDTSQHTHICVNSLTPPQVNMPELRDNDPARLGPVWTAYVPAEAVDAYKAHPYWYTYCKIEPITDKLIPLLGEYSVELEPGETYEFLSDVMPLGNAVPKDSGTWTSANPEVATIDDNGILTAVAPGETTITFSIKSTDGKDYMTEAAVKIDYDYTDDEWQPVTGFSKPDPETFYILTDIHAKVIMGTDQSRTPKYRGLRPTEVTNSDYQGIKSIPANSALLRFSPASSAGSGYADNQYIVSVFDTQNNFLGYLNIPGENELEITVSRFSPATIDFYDPHVAIQFGEYGFIQYKDSAPYFAPRPNYINRGDVRLYKNITTGIKEMTDESVPERSTRLVGLPDGVYNLHGQRIADKIDNLAPGLYIRVSDGRAAKVFTN